jgi:uncharacterized membrane protein YkvA (DUF1232 family)
VPWYTKGLAIAVAGYALSPIDLIPDFIPVIGLIDDAVIVPLGILLVIRLLSPDILAEHRATATRLSEAINSSTSAARLIPPLIQILSPKSPKFLSAKANSTNLWHFGLTPPRELPTIF